MLVMHALAVQVLHEWPARPNRNGHLDACWMFCSDLPPSKHDKQRRRPERVLLEKVHKQTRTRLDCFDLGFLPGPALTAWWQRSWSIRRDAWRKMGPTTSTRRRLSLPAASSTRARSSRCAVSPVVVVQQPKHGRIMY